MLHFWLQSAEWRESGLEATSPWGCSAPPCSWSTWGPAAGGRYTAGSERRVLSEHHSVWTAHPGANPLTSTYTKRVRHNIIISLTKEISMAPIYHTKWESRLLYNSTNNARMHACTHTHARMHTHTPMHRQIDMAVKKLKKRYWAGGSGSWSRRWFWNRKKSVWDKLFQTDGPA